MSEESKQRDFLTQLTLCFPETIRYKIEGKGEKEGEYKTLQRRILFIDDKDTFEDIPDQVSRYVIPRGEDTKVGDACKEILDQLLGILDINLGSTYEQVSNIIYENKLSWKINKREEMLSPNLIYVIYGVNDGNEGIFEPLMYLSFMLTEEIDISKDGLIELVIYLYEIQLLPDLRGQGIGQTMIQYLKATSTQYNESRHSDGNDISSIALTVFSSNERAFKFYTKLGFQYTVGSPRDERIVSIANRTRRRQARSTCESGSNKGYRVIKPIYYLLYVPIK